MLICGTITVVQRALEVPTAVLPQGASVLAWATVVIVIACDLPYGETTVLLARGYSRPALSGDAATRRYYLYEKIHVRQCYHLPSYGSMAPAALFRPVNSALSRQHPKPIAVRWLLAFTNTPRLDPNPSADYH